MKLRKRVFETIEQSLNLWNNPKQEAQTEAQRLLEEARHNQVRLEALHADKGAYSYE